MKILSFTNVEKIIPIVDNDNEKESVIKAV